MPLLESESIVLKSYDLAEADRIVVLFTRDFGLVRGVAKGVKRTKSKYGSSLEPFSQVKLVFVQKDERELVSIQSAELIRSEFNVASDPERLATFSYLSELLNEFTQPHDPNETLYRMVKACFESDLNSLEENEGLKFYFESWLLRLSGYLPDWSECSRCRRQFTDAETTILTTESKLLCMACDQGRNRDSITPENRSLFRHVRKTSPTEFLKDLSSDSNAIRELRNILRPILVGVIGRQPASVLAAEGVSTK